MIKELRLLWMRTFDVISNEKAKELNLIYVKNVYGDMINKLNCRSIWEDDNGRQYRVKLLVHGDR